MINNYSRVKMLTDKYAPDGAPLGAVGSIIETYENGECEVEFSDANGIDYAQIVAREDELQLDEPAPQAPVFSGGSVITDINLHQKHKQTTFLKP